MIVYNNLGQSIGERMVYFRSTDIEQLNYERLLWSVPDEMFYFLSIGHSIKVVDISSNKGKIENIFIPVLNDIMNKILFRKEPLNRKLKNHFEIAYDVILNNKSLWKKYSFWTDKIQRVEILAETIHVEKEPNTIYN